MTKAEIFSFAGQPELLARRGRTLSRQVVLPFGFKSANSSRFGNFALLQRAIRERKRILRFIVAQTVASVCERVERSRSDNAPVGKCLLISCGECRKRLTRANIIAQLIGAARETQSRSAANRKRLILHIPTSRSQHIFQHNSLCSLRWFVTCRSSSNKGGNRSWVRT